MKWLKKPRRPEANRNRRTAPAPPHSLELKIEEGNESIKEEIISLKDSIQNQIHDVFIELRGLRKEILYIASRKKQKDNLL